MQSALMTKPTLTLFRTKYDADHAPEYLNPSYVYNFFDNSNIKPAKKLVKNKLCFVARIDDVKDPLRLIRIAKQLSEVNKDFILDIYGNGSLVEQCKEEIKKLNLDKKVFLKGFTKDKNIYAKYSMLVMTSKYEGLPMSIIEAKANGIPTISTPWGKSISEVITSGKDGYVCESDNDFVETINNILTDEKLQEKLSKNALKSFEKFSKENAYKTWIDILENYKKR